MVWCSFKIFCLLTNSRSRTQGLHSHLLITLAVYSAYHYELICITVCIPALVKYTPVYSILLCLLHGGFKNVSKFVGCLIPTLSVILVHGLRL